MPLYHFQVQDGPATTDDPEGRELPGNHAVRAHAMSVVGEIAFASPSDDDRRAITVDVSDATGTVIYTATMLVAGKWLS
jgi:hypothetical protein